VLNLKAMNKYSLIGSVLLNVVFVVLIVIYFPQFRKPTAQKILEPVNFEALAKERIDRILKESPKQVSIVMLGNSITEGGGDWNKRLGRTDIRNSGQGGYTTGQMLWYLDTCVIKARPEKCFILAGINDLSLKIPLETVYANYIQILDKLRKRKIQAIVQSTLLQTNNLAGNRNVVRLNNLLSTYCAENNLIFIDLNSSLSNVNGLIPEYTTDGTHLTEKGYEVWSNILKPYLNKE